MSNESSQGPDRRIRTEFGTGRAGERSGFVTELSHNGMLVVGERPYPIGTLVRVKLFLDEPVEVDTVVVWSKKTGSGGKLGMGLRFLNPSPRLASLLESEIVSAPAVSESGLEPAPEPTGQTEPTGLAPLDSELEAEKAPAAPAEVDEMETLEVEPQDAADSEGHASETAAVAQEPAQDEAWEPVVTSEVERAAVAPARSSTPAGRPLAERAAFERRLAESEARCRRLERMLDDDEREKKMLRKLVAKLEASRDELTSELAASRRGASQPASGETLDSEPAAAGTDRFELDLGDLGDVDAEQEAALAVAEAEVVRLRERVRSLEDLHAEESASTPAGREPSRGLGRWLLPVALAVGGAVSLGALTAFLVPRLVDSRPAAEMAAEATIGRAPVASREVGSARAASDEAAAPGSGGRDVGTPSIAAEVSSEEDVPILATDSDVPDGLETQGSDDRTQAATDVAVAVEDTVNSWARAWTDQRVEDYLDFYSVGFEPATAISLSDWRQQRQERIRRPSWIRVTVDRVNVKILSPEIARVQFDQTYETATYRDRVRKTLELVLEDGIWVIEQERSEEI